MYEASFADHIAKYEVVIKDGKDFVSRLQIFADNYDMIEAHNADPNSTFKMGFNKFTHLTLDEYLSFFFAFHFAFGLSFELPAMSMLLAFLDIISVDSFRKSWRYALLFLAVFSAMVTPPDMFSMMALMLPMLLLFLLSGLIVWFIQRKNKI